MELTASSNLTIDKYAQPARSRHDSPATQSRRLLRDSLKIAFIVTRSDSFGGSSVHIRDLARVLMQAGHQTMVFIGGEGPVTDAYRAAGIPFISLRHLIREVAPYTDLRGFLELREALQKFQPDLVSAHTSKAGFLGRLASWSLGVPAIYTPHCWSFGNGFPNARFYLWAERLARPFGKNIIMVSEAERSDGLKGRVGDASHLVTVHNGMPDIPEELRAEPRLSPPRLTMVGRFEKQKDHATLLRALARLKDLPWTFENIGDGPLRPEVETMVRKLGLEDRVSLLGYRKDAVNCLCQSQIYVLISHWEGLPRSILEAMRAGLPVVASKVGGNAEAVEDGRTGFIVKPLDVDGLTARLRALIDDPELRAKFSAAGRRRYEEKFTFDLMVEKTLKVWESVLGHPVPLPARTQSSSPSVPQPVAA